MINYRVRIDPKDDEIHAIVVYIKGEKGPVSAALRVIANLTDVAHILTIEHVTSVHQCKNGEYT